MPFAIAEQVHGNLVARVDAPDGVPFPWRRCAGYAAEPDLCLAIYVADCAAVYLGRQGNAGDRTRARREERRRAWYCDRSHRDHAQRIRKRPSKSCDAGGSLHPASTLRGRFRCGPRSASSRRRSARHFRLRHLHGFTIRRITTPYRREKGRTGRLLALAAIVSRRRN